jgi:hypothetical protein
MEPTESPAAPVAFGVPSAPRGSQPAFEGDDPEQSAQSFVDRNQKEAEEHLKALTAEAQQLRARLAKLESGIKRWQSLVNALKASRAQAAAGPVSERGSEEAGELEPIKPARADGPRADKRVRWASATPASAAPGVQPAQNVDAARQQAGGAPLPQPVAPAYGPR